MITNNLDNGVRIVTQNIGYMHTVTTGTGWPTAPAMKLPKITALLILLNICCLNAPQRTSDHP